MSVFTYNGVGFEACRTTMTVSEERDESGTDSLWTVYRVKVIGIPVAAGGSLVTPSAVTIAAIKEKLAVPRKQLLYAMNDGVAILAVNGLDAAMGPKLEGEARVLGTTSASMFMEVNYKVCLRDCATGNPNPVVSLRWESTESFTQLHHGKIATSGTLVVRSDLRQSADSFRDLCTPKVPTKYIRTTAEYRLSHDGCRLHFNFVDEEQSVMPPVVARKASGRFMVNVSKGSMRYGQCDVRLETGPQGQSKENLMVVALKICLAKLQAEGLGDGNLLDIKASESLWEQSVDVSMSARLQPTQTAEAAKKAGDRIAFFKSIGDAPDAIAHKDGLGPDGLSHVGGLLVALFRDPCAAAIDADPEMKTKKSSTKPGMKRTPQPGPNTRIINGEVRPGGGGGASAFSLTVSDLPFATTTVVKDGVAYDYYLIESHYHDDSGRRPLPATGVASRAASLTGGGMPPGQGRRASIVTVSGGLTTLVVTWAASRTGMPPVLPAKESADPNFVYIDGDIIPAQVRIAGDGYSPIYAVSGSYYYTALNPDAVAYAAPVPPFLADAVGPAAGLAAGHFSNDVLWKFRGLPYQVGRQPNDQLTKQLGGPADQPIRLT